MDKQGKYAILFAATILAARKFAGPGIKPSGAECVISDAISSAAHILERNRRTLAPQASPPAKPYTTLPARVFGQSTLPSEVH